ncbi:MAG: DegV family protein [Chloroflexi bacterium]|nr:DegV family protein [Chloroflexota bacterium]
MTIKVVTDSTSDLPRELVDKHGITIVPVNVHFGDQAYRDGVDLSADEFYQRLTQGSDFPKTSQPSVGAFVDVFLELAKDAEAIISIHISSKLSGTHNSAVQAKAQVASETSCRIEVIDSRQASMGLGIIALETARAARSYDNTIEDVLNAASHAMRRCQCLAMIDTLEYLQRGGRIGRARAVLGTLLRIRPMIIVRDGEVDELGKERSRSRALARLEQVVRSFAPLAELSVLYSTDPEDAQRLADSLKDILPRDRQPIIARFGPSLGTHVGPGSVGVGLLRV